MHVQPLPSRDPAPSTGAPDLLQDVARIQSLARESGRGLSMLEATHIALRATPEEYAQTLPTLDRVELGAETARAPVVILTSPPADATGQSLYLIDACQKIVEAAGFACSLVEAVQLTARATLAELAAELGVELRYGVS